MKPLLLASILAFSFATPSTVLADEAPREIKPKVPATCPVAKGTLPIFSVQERPKDSKRKPESSTEFFLYDNGAWVVKKEVPTKNGEGCLSASNVKAVKDALGRATWKTTTSGVACDAVATHTTSYVVNNKVVLRREICDAIVLDKATENALADVMKIVTPLIASAR